MRTISVTLTNGLSITGYDNVVEPHYDGSATVTLQHNQLVHIPRNVIHSITESGPSEAFAPAVVE